MKQIDYLIVGSGLASLSFAALMAKKGKRICILEAHEHPGGFGHTFQMANKYKFNAQLHYVWNCGEGDTVDLVLKRLGLDEDITFETYDPDGFDHMHIPGYDIKIPSDSDELIKRLTALFPSEAEQIIRFVSFVNKIAIDLDRVSYATDSVADGLKNIKSIYAAYKYSNYTLQDAFNEYNLPKPAQSLLASQWPDFLLPPDQLSFFAWVMLFTGYQRGAYYPTDHFEHVIESLVNVVRENGGEIRFNHEVSGYIEENGKILGVDVKNLETEEKLSVYGNCTICNMDPKKAAQMIGLEKFSKSIRKKLDYDYSYSNFMAYVVVKDLDLTKYGFGRWNTFHSGHDDINVAFNKMYYEYDYSNPSFAITTPTLMTSNRDDCPEDCQIVEFLTVADYGYFREIKDRDEKEYKKRKMSILNAILDVVESQYIPDFRKHMVFKMTGSPTTNERYCWVPKGNSYGSNMTPRNIGIGRLKHNTSLKNFYFCNASSGFAGFTGTIWTGARLYSILSGDKFL